MMVSCMRLPFLQLPFVEYACVYFSKSQQALNAANWTIMFQFILAVVEQEEAQMLTSWIREPKIAHPGKLS